jgi:hypothetical protein
MWSLILMVIHQSQTQRELAHLPEQEHLQTWSQSLILTQSSIQMEIHLNLSQTGQVHLQEQALHRTWSQSSIQTEIPPNRSPKGLVRLQEQVVQDWQSYRCRNLLHCNRQILIH